MPQTKTSPPAPSWARRRINDTGLALIKEFEGLHLTPYQCPGHVWTIGYGHTRSVHQKQRLTEAEAEALLREDLETAELTVEHLVEVPLNENQFSALVSFAFNVGFGNFRRSTLLRLLNRGWYEQVPAQLMRWTKAGNETLGGLTRRRAAESRLWNKAAPDE